MRGESGERRCSLPSPVPDTFFLTADTSSSWHPVLWAVTPQTAGDHQKLCAEVTPLGQQGTSPCRQRGLAFTRMPLAGFIGCQRWHLPPVYLGMEEAGRTAGTSAWAQR